MFQLECEWVTPGSSSRSGFDLGHMTFTSGEGTCSSRGRTPDQAMMVILSIVELLDGLRRFLAGSAPDYLFVGTDSSFSVRFRKAKKGRVALQCGATSLGEVESGTLCRAILSGVEAFVSRPESALAKGDAARDDLVSALEGFRQALPR